MRSLSTTLEKAQKAGAKNALVKIVLTYDGNTYTYTKARIIDIKQTEDGSRQSAQILLDNNDGTLTDLDLKGYQGVLSYGLTTSAGDEYSACAPMWVLAQEFDSDPNKLTCTLSMVGICNLMADDEASAKYMPADDDTKTVKTLVNEVIGATMACFNHCTAYQVEWDAGYDALADTYKPKDAFRVYIGNNRLSAMNRLLEYTLNVAVVKDDGKIHIMKPTTTGSSYDYEYSLDRGQHVFFSKALRNRLVTPNYIVVKSREDDDPQYSGYATDADSYAKLPKRHYKLTRLESNAQGTAIAEALLARAQMWCEGGAANVPLNVGAEAFDYVKVTDSREDDSRTGNTGKLVRNYNARKNEWTMGFAFGNWQTVRKVLANLGITSDEIENYFSRLTVGDLYVEHILAENMDFIWIDPDNTIDLSQIGDNIDNLGDGELYARVKTLHLDAGQIKLDEYILYNPGYNASEKRRTFTATPTTPYDIGDLWLDADTVKRCTTARASGAYVAGDWTQTTLDALADGVTYQRVKSASLTAEGLVILDEVVAGTYGLVYSTDIQAGSIKLSSVVQTSSYQTATSSQKSSWTNKPDDLDDPNIEGVTYKRVKATEVDAGRITLTVANYFSGKYSGKWYQDIVSAAGVTIEAGVGINIFGKDSALRTRATETGTVQCYVGTDGGIYAGAGAVKLSATGLLLDSAMSYGILKMKYGSNEGKISLSSGGDIMLEPESGQDVAIFAKRFDLANTESHMLARKTSAPTSPSNGMMVYNPSSGYLNIYDGPAARWWHCDRTWDFV